MLLEILFQLLILHGISIARHMAVMELAQQEELVAGKTMLLLLRYVGVLGGTERVPVLLRSLSTARARTRLGISVFAVLALAEPCA